MSLKLKKVPGFADVADANFAAGQYAVGLNFQRILGNVKFGMVRPEFFSGTYKHGDTVALPTSTVDGYTYQRDELLYLYTVIRSGDTSASGNGMPTGAGSLWYFNVKVDQDTGDVTSYITYRTSDSASTAVTTNDGLIQVTTIGQRRKTTLTATNAVYSDVLDAELATDAALSEGIAQRLNRNAKFSVVASEIIHMGEFTNQTNVPLPVSPVDGHVYSRAEVRHMFSWRWTTDPNIYQAPNYNQVGGIGAFVDDPSGNVSMGVDFYDSHNYPTAFGRIDVIAFCTRSATPATATPPDFVDIAEELFASGSKNSLRFDVLRKLTESIRYSIGRPEFFRSSPVGNFSGLFTHGQVVPLPVSPLDGYAYTREECIYLVEMQDTRVSPTDIRIVSWYKGVDQNTGQVFINLTRLHDGGSYSNTNDGRVVVLTIGLRDHVETQPGDHQYTGTGSTIDSDGALKNGGFDSWSGAPTQPVADFWYISNFSGTGVASKAPGLISGFSQRLSTLAGVGDIRVMSSRVRITPGDLRVYSFARQPNAALPSGFWCRFHLFSAIGDELFFDTLASAPIPAGLTNFEGWVQIPKQGDITVATNGGALTITNLSGVASALTFIPTHIAIELIVITAGIYVDFDEFSFISQLDPSTAQIAQRGSNSIAVFPAIPWNIAPSTFAPNLALTFLRVDGTQTTTPASWTPNTNGLLTPGTTYAWYPYYDEKLKIIKHTRDSSSIGGGVSFPSSLHIPMEPTDPTYASRASALFAEWYAPDHVPLAASPIQITTLATGAPPSGGSGGGSGGCLHENMWVDTPTGAVQVKYIRSGDRVLGEGGIYLRVIDTMAMEHFDWIDLTLNHGGKLTTTTGHPFINVEGDEVRAWDLTVQTMLKWQHGVCTPTCISYRKEKGVKIKVSLEAPHMFYAGTTPDKMTLTHNIRVGTFTI